MKPKERLVLFSGDCWQWISDNGGVDAVRLVRLRWIEPQIAVLSRLGETLWRSTAGGDWRTATTSDILVMFMPPPPPVFLGLKLGPKQSVCDWELTAIVVRVN